MHFLRQWGCYNAASVGGSQAMRRRDALKRLLGTGLLGAMPAALPVRVAATPPLMLQESLIAGSAHYASIP